MYNELGARESLKIYSKNPGTFTSIKHKEFEPRFFSSEECTHTQKCTPTFPKEFSYIVPMPKTEKIFMDWGWPQNTSIIDKIPFDFKF